ncbi:hypothetical protein FRC09_007477 [Ceratobasidium sp. 395]|nr:hypothetical protein FRC09_007477 [Ceratobasidium sp. 395]
MGSAFDKGVVLVMSVWDDHAANMLWLDSSYPTNLPATNPGVTRGRCATTSGVPADIESKNANASVTYSNIRFGDIGSTYTGAGTTTTPGNPTTPVTTSSSPSPTSGGTVPHYGQCGGQGWTGGTVCVAPYKCTVSNQYYSQCL